MLPSHRRKDPMAWTPSVTLATRPATHAPRSTSVPSANPDAASDGPQANPVPMPGRAEEPVLNLPKEAVWCLSEQAVEGNERALIPAQSRALSEAPQIQSPAAPVPNPVVSRQMSLANMTTFPTLQIRPSGSCHRMSSFFRPRLPWHPCPHPPPPSLEVSVGLEKSSL